MNDHENTVVITTTAILETLLINILVTFFFYNQQPNQEVYLVLNPHPLFIFSLIMGLRYGIRIGTFSAFISCLAYYDVYDQVFGNAELFFTQFKYYIHPLTFLWGGFIVGAFRDNHRRKQRKANETIELLRETNTHLERDYGYLESIQKDLKSQIIQADESIISLYDIAKRLGSFEIEDLYTETIGIIKKYIKATKISLYTVDTDHDFLRLKISYGDFEATNSIKASTCSWYSLVEKERKVLKNPDYTENDTLPLMVAPLVRHEKIIALLLVHSMEFDMVSEYAFTLFQLIVDWINRTLETATFVESLLENRFIGNTLLIHDSKYFLKHIKIERRRKNEFGIDYCILSYRVKNYELQELDALVRKTLRPVDKAYYNKNKQVITFLFPATKRENVIFIEDRILKNSNNRLEKIYLDPLEKAVT